MWKCSHYEFDSVTFFFFISMIFNKPFLMIQNKRTIYKSKIYMFFILFYLRKNELLELIAANVRLANIKTMKCHCNTETEKWEEVTSKTEIPGNRKQY